ncbi:hypothetical protein AbraIFM66950_007697 [Aspergillus brasiliensis]|nr:hypothetical protein AbraIFM66950_007697 [Aspergillus brasiliensis]
MAPAILIIGATGNTGRSVAETLPKLLKSSHIMSEDRVLALTRSAGSPVARQIAELPGVRAFVASPVDPSQFAEESTFLVAALNAGVKYVVRISTTAANVRPDCKAFYPRTHWAIESLLSSPEFASLQWTSLQPNVFSPLYLSTAAELIKQYRKTGEQDTLRLMASKDAPVGIIDPYEIGVFAAHLLSQVDPVPHNKARYVLNGPEDITGKHIVDMVEQHIGAQVKDVSYKDVSFVDYLASSAESSQAKTIILSLKNAPETAWEGKCTASTTSKEVLDIAAPKRTPAEVLKTLLEA